VGIETKLGFNVFKIDKERHITIRTEICNSICKNRACLYMCPALLYKLDDEGNITVDWEGCLECGTCMICCKQEALEWGYPRGEFGIQYRMA
jgi:ferredoxin like protein